MTAPIASRRFPSLLLLALCGALLLGNGCHKKPEEAPEVSVVVQAAHPTQGPIAEEIVADAILAPVSAAALSSRLSAPIRAEYVQRGAHVRRGQLLVSLDDRDLRGSALDSRGALATAQANLTATTQTTIPEELHKAELDTTQLKAALDVAARTARERQSLLRQGAISGREADAAVATEVQAQAAYDAARQHAALLTQTTRLTDRQAAQGQLTSAEGRLANAQAQVSFANLRSPIDGVVTERPLFPGETVAAGTPILTIMDTSSLLAKLHLAQASAQKLTLGHAARVTVPGVDEPVAATVSFIGPALDPGSTTVEVWLKLPNAGGTLKVGTPVHAVLQGAIVPDALQVPTAAIMPADDGSTGVLLVTAGGTVQKRSVTVGIRTVDSVQILSGLAATDTVVTGGGYGLDNATKVTVGKPGAAAAETD